MTELLKQLDALVSTKVNFLFRWPNSLFMGPPSIRQYQLALASEQLFMCPARLENESEPTNSGASYRVVIARHVSTPRGM